MDFRTANGFSEQTHVILVPVVDIKIPDRMAVPVEMTGKRMPFVSDRLPVFLDLFAAKRTQIDISGQTIVCLGGLYLRLAYRLIRIDGTLHIQEISQRSDQERILFRPLAFQEGTWLHADVEFHGEGFRIVLPGTLHREIRRKRLVHIARAGVHAHRETAPIGLGRQRQIEIGRRFVIEHYAARI